MTVPLTGDLGCWPSVSAPPAPVQPPNSHKSRISHGDISSFQMAIKHRLDFESSPRQHPISDLRFCQQKLILVILFEGVGWRVSASNGLASRCAGMGRGQDRAHLYIFSSAALKAAGSADFAEYPSTAGKCHWYFFGFPVSKLVYHSGSENALRVEDMNRRTTLEVCSVVLIQLHAIPDGHVCASMASTSRSFASVAGSAESPFGQSSIASL